MSPLNLFSSTRAQSRRVDRLMSEYADDLRRENAADSDALDSSAEIDAALGEPVGLATENDRPSRARKRKRRSAGREKKTSQRAAARQDARARKRAMLQERQAEREAQNEQRWYSGKRNFVLNQLGTYELTRPEIRSTTRQLEAGQLAVAQPPTRMEGLIMGLETEGDGVVCHDPFTSYGSDIKSPNTATIGEVGSGKSSLEKTWNVLRPLILGRRVVILDKKSQKDATGKESGVGEYTALARRLGVEPIRFVIGGGAGSTRINLLDPAITAATDDSSTPAGVGRSDQRPATQSMLLRSVVEEVLGRGLDAYEGKALRVAHQRAILTAKAEDRVAVIGDVIEAMFNPEEEDAESFHGTAEDLRGWGRAPAFELERMVDDDLAGLIDGPTSDNVRLNSGLMVFDLSALPESGPSLSVVMTIINTWLANMLRNQTVQVRTHLVVEEAWHLVRGSFAKVTQQNAKLSRGLGLSSNFAFHHISDIPVDSPAIAMIKECDTILVYRQSRTDDGEMVERLFDFPRGTAQILPYLDDGVSFCKIGRKKPFVLLHKRSSLEVELTNTDAAMTSRGTTAI